VTPGMRVVHFRLYKGLNIINGGNTRASKHRYFVLDTLLEIGKLD